MVPRQTTALLGSMQNSSQLFYKILEDFMAMPPFQLMLVVLCCFFYLIGGLGVGTLHCHRIGKPVMRSLFHPVYQLSLIRDFNLKEWLLLAMVAALTLVIGVLAALAG